MAAGMAHLFELPNKIHLSREDYLTVQQIYRGWALLGIAHSGRSGVAASGAGILAGEARIHAGLRLDEVQPDAG